MLRCTWVFVTTFTLLLCWGSPAAADEPAQATPTPQATPAGIVVKARPVSASVPQVTQGVPQQQVPQVITQPPAPQVPVPGPVAPKKRRDDPVSFFFGFLKHLFGIDDDDPPDVY